MAGWWGEGEESGDGGGGFVEEFYWDGVLISDVVEMESDFGGVASHACVVFLLGHDRRRGLLPVQPIST